MADEEPSALLVTPLQADKIRRALKKLDNITGVGVVNGPDYVAINPPGPRGIGSTPQDKGVLVKPTSNATGGGKYYGYIVKPPLSAIAVTGNLAATEIGDVTGTVETVLILNMREEGKSTHDLTFSTYLPLHFIGRFNGQVTTETPPKRVVVIDGVQQEDC